MFAPRHLLILILCSIVAIAVAVPMWLRDGAAPTQAAGETVSAVSAGIGITPTATLTPTHTPTPSLTPTPTTTKQPHPADTDGDGCSDEQENGATASTGGMRGFKNPWDFFNPDWNPLTGSGANKAVSLNNIFDTAGRFGATGNPNDAWDPSAAAGTYNRAFDRGPGPGPNRWNRGSPDGAIAISDVFAIADQFAHAC